MPQLVVVSISIRLQEKPVDVSLTIRLVVSQQANPAFLKRAYPSLPIHLTLSKSA